MAVSSRPKPKIDLNASLEATYFTHSAFRDTENSIFDPDFAPTDLPTLTPASKSLILSALAYIRQPEKAGQNLGRIGYLEAGDVIEQAISLCVDVKAEETACALLRHFPGEFPVSLVHKAGEKGLIRLLKCLYDHQILIKANKTLFNVRLKFRRLLKRKLWKPILDTQSKSLCPIDLLKWACLSPDPRAVWYFPHREVLSYNLPLDPEPTTDLLITYDLDEVLFELAKTRKLPVGQSEVLVMLRYERLKLVEKVVKLNKSILTRATPYLLADYKVIQKLTELVSKAEASIGALFLLSQISIEDWELVEVESLSIALQDLSAGGDLETNGIVNSLNPLLLCVSAAEMCGYICEWGLSYREKFLILKNSFLQIATHLQSQYVDYRKLKQLYIEKSYGKRCAFDLITAKPEEYRSLLKSPTVVNIVKDLWRGGENLGFGLHCCCLPSAYLTLLASPSDLWTVHSQFIAKLRTPSVFQYYYWKRDGYIRHLMETGFLIAIYGTMVYILVTYLHVNAVFLDPMATAEEINSAVELYQSMSKLQTFIITYTFFPMLYHVQVIFYKMLLGESWGFDLRFLFDIVFFLLSLEIRIQQAPEIMNQMNSDTAVFSQEITYGLLFLFNGLRLCLIILQTQTFGPILRMIYLISKDISAYLLLYVLSLFAFSMLFTTWFWREPQFASIQQTALTLFKWSIGGFDVGEFSTRAEVGAIMSCIWAMIAAVLLLNLLIAVLSARYEELAPQAMADYVSIVYHSYSQTRYDPSYGCIVLAPAPLNILTFPAVFLFLLSPRRAKRINAIFSVISYQLDFLLGVLLFTLYSLSVAVLMYFYVIYAIFRRFRPKETLWTLPWLILGPFYLCYLCIASYRPLLKYLYLDKFVIQASDEYEFLSPLRSHLSVCSQIPQFPAYCELADLLPSLVRFPGKGSQIQMSRGATFTALSRIAERVYYSKTDFARKNLREITEFLQQFVSLSEQSDSQRIDIRRVSKFMDRLRNTPERLMAVSTRYVQEAIRMQVSPCPLCAVRK